MEGDTRELRVVIVDDSSLMRRMLKDILHRDRIEVVGMASDGREGLDMVGRLRPDLITLDVEMPRLNGLQTLEELRARDRKTRVIMLSSLTHHGAEVTLDALAAGADDYLAKPSGQNGAMVFEMLLCQKVRQFFLPRFEPAAKASGTPPNAVPQKARLPSVKKRILAIGASTGGPSALKDLLEQLPKNFSFPVVVTQHMPARFTTRLAERLQSQVQLAVREAKPDDLLVAGQVLIAPGDFHLEVVGNGGRMRARLTQEAPEHYCRPAVDVMLRSVHRSYAGGAVVAILTGMGTDGLEGTRLLRQEGAHIIAQDQASSVVWGMPGAVAREGLADAVIPLSQMGPEIMKQMQ